MWKALCLLTLLALSSLGSAEEIPFLVKGTVQGKVGEQTFEQAFEVRMNPDQRHGFRIENLKDVDVELGLAPRWRYGNGPQPEGILLNIFLKCRGQGLKLQRFASAAVAEGKNQTVELHAKDEANLFTVEVEVNPLRPQGSSPEPGPETKE